MGLFKLLPNLSSKQRGYTETLSLVVKASLFQFALMASITIFFIMSDQGAATTYHYLASLRDFVPIVRRFYAIIDRADQNVEFHRIFSIYMSYAAIQIFIFLFLAFHLLSRIQFTRVGSKGRLKFWVGLTVILLGYFFIFVGNYDLANSAGKYANRVGSGDYTFYFWCCLLIPIANFFLFSAVLTRYGNDLRSIRSFE